MSSQYFPVNDRALRDWLVNFATQLSNNLATFGMVAADITDLDGEISTFDGALDAYIAQQTLYQSALGAKKESRIKAIALLRPIVTRIQSHPAMTDALRGLLGLPLRSSSTATGSGLPSDVPSVFLETEPGRVYVHFGSDPTNEQINGKPAGVKGCNIYRKKAGDENFQLVAYQSASPYVDFISGDGSDYSYFVTYRGNKASDLGQPSAPQTIAARGEVVQNAA